MLINLILLNLYFIWIIHHYSVIRMLLTLTVGVLRENPNHGETWTSLVPRHSMFLRNLNILSKSLNCLIGYLISPFSTLNIPERPQPVKSWPEKA